MTTQNFEKINDIFNCKLHLEDGTEFTIPLREDGYIYGTGLCKITNKRMYNWLRLKETKLLMKQIEEKSLIGTNIIEIHKGGNNKDCQGTWIHPDLGLNLAQWCSPHFSYQVSKWLRELLFTMNVELGNEKKNQEINDNYQEICDKLKEKLEETEEKLEEVKNINKDISKKYVAIKINHQAFLRRKELYKLKTGPCVYIIDMKKTHDEEEMMRFKIGQTGDITKRVCGFRTSNPFCKVIAVLYTDKNIDLEKNMKIKYEKQLFPNNSEFVSGVSKETLLEDLLKLSDILNLDYTIETDEELDKFNARIFTEKDVEKDVEKEIVDDDKVSADDMKRCGGLHHETEESRLQPVSNYFKNKANENGISRLCKECYLIGKYGDDRKKKKVVEIPKYDISSQKWCNFCETVKEHNEFYPDKNKKDGLNSNCKACRAEQKKKVKEEKNKNNPPVDKKKLMEKEEEKVKQIESKNPLERFSKNELIQLLKKQKGENISMKKNKTELIQMLQ